jgi:ribosomal-protein-alanine N-acetyltransferase
MSIGTRRSHRRKGIGELLLHSALINLIEKGVRSLTLEVRVSNVPAISLYEKYGMTTQGLRKSYYTDNREDAKIMTVADIQSLDYRHLLNSKWEKLEERLKK